MAGLIYAIDKDDFTLEIERPKERLYAVRLSRIEELWGAPADTPEGAELDALMALVEKEES